MARNVLIATLRLACSLSADCVGALCPRRGVATASIKPPETKANQTLRPCIFRTSFSRTLPIDNVPPPYIVHSSPRNPTLVHVVFVDASALHDKFDALEFSDVLQG